MLAVRTSAARQNVIIIIIIIIIVIKVSVRYIYVGVQLEHSRARRCGCQNTVNSTTSTTLATVRLTTRGTERRRPRVTHVTERRSIASRSSSRAPSTDSTEPSLSAAPLTVGWSQKTVPNSTTRTPATDKLTTILQLVIQQICHIAMPEPKPN